MKPVLIKIEARRGLFKYCLRMRVYELKWNFRSAFLGFKRTFKSRSILGNTDMFLNVVVHSAFYHTFRHGFWVIK